MSSVRAQIFAIREGKSGKGSLACSAEAASEPLVLGALLGLAELSDTAPDLACRLCGGSNSKPPVSVDRAEDTTSVGVGVSSRSSSRTVAKELGGLPDFLPY